MPCPAVRCRAVPCGAVRCLRCPAVRCGAVRCGVVRCCAVLCGAVRCCAVQCGAVRCCAVLCGAIVCCDMLCCTIPSHPILCLDILGGLGRRHCGCPIAASGCEGIAPALTSAPPLAVQVEITIQGQRPRFPCRAYPCSVALTEGILLICVFPLLTYMLCGFVSFALVVWKTGTHIASPLNYPQCRSFQTSI